MKLHRRTGRVEASFASKLVATLNTDLLTTNKKGLTLLHAIDLDENGASLTVQEVWTGTNADGTIKSNCDGWSTGDGGTLAVVGLSSATDGTWTAVYDQFCDRTMQHLYCFEQ